jgi:hypothetical protein
LKLRIWAGPIALSFLAVSVGAQAPAPTPPAYAENLQVTATRVPENIDEVPASIQVVTSQELRDRGANNLERQGFRDERTSFKKGHVLWRNRRAWSGSVLRFDLDATFLRQQPASPTPRTGRTLTPLVPLDSNQNPAGAHLDEDRYFVSTAYDRALSFGTWHTALAYTHSGQKQLRGFLTDVSNDVPNAAGFRAEIDQNDLYLDTHLALTRSARWRLVTGLDHIRGRAAAEGDTFGYGVDLETGNPSSPDTPGEGRSLEDRRDFAGLYANLEWTPAPAWRLEAGLRLNRTEEERGEREAAAGEGAEEEDRREDLRGLLARGRMWDEARNDRFVGAVDDPGGRGARHRRGPDCERYRAGGGGEHADRSHVPGNTVCRATGRGATVEGAAAGEGLAGRPAGRRLWPPVHAAPRLRRHGVPQRRRERGLPVPERLDAGPVG